MNRLSLNLFFSCLCSFFFIATSSFATANEEATEPFPKVIKVDEKKEAPTEMSDSSFLIETIGGQRGISDADYLKRIHANSYYHLVAFSDNGDVVQLHDGSKWQVEASGRQQVLYWAKSDEIFIKPCISWFSSNQYVLHNRTLNQVVKVNIKSAPLPMGAYTLRVVNIEPYDRLVLLSDHTVWQVGPDSNFSRWRIGQRVFAGVNNQWRTAPYPQILINVDIPGNPFSPVIFYGYPAE
ncbi:MAG: hypothetical protein ACH350_06175 [Parachlamydiaceae bacterium]